MEVPIEFGWGVVTHLNSVKNSPELREAYQQVQPDVVKATTTLTQSLPVYNAMKVNVFYPNLVTRRKQMCKNFPWIVMYQGTCLVLELTQFPTQLL